MNIYSSFSQLSQRTMLNLLRHSTQVQNTFLTTSQEAAGFRRVVDGADRSLTYEVVGAAQVVVPHCDLQSLVGQL